MPPRPSGARRCVRGRSATAPLCDGSHGAQGWACFDGAWAAAPHLSGTVTIALQAADVPRLRRRPWLSPAEALVEAPLSAAQSAP